MVFLLVFVWHIPPSEARKTDVGETQAAGLAEAEGLAEREVEVLEEQYNQMPKQEILQRKAALTEEQFQLNVKLNSEEGQRPPLSDELRKKIARTHMELEIIHSVLDESNTLTKIWIRYKTLIQILLGLLAGLVLITIVQKLRKAQQVHEILPPLDNLESEQNGASSLGVHYKPIKSSIQSLEVDEQALSGEGSRHGKGAIPIGDIQAHVDSMMLGNPSSYRELLDFFFQQAILWHASDIHFHRSGGWFGIKFRIDGELYDICVLDPYREQEILNIIKVMARLKTYENRMTQEGRMEFRFGNKLYEFRISVAPTMGTEKIVVRIFGDDEISFDINRLGFSIDTTESLKTSLAKRSGLILLVGPAGSGKTTTIYSSLNHLKTAMGGMNITTLEDPIEHSLEGITQIQINPIKNVSFESGFQNLLRMDTEVIMIGEIRDGNVADLVMRAGNTGHMIISTVHSSTTLGAVDRMLSLGCDSYSLHTSLSAVLSQRLVKQVCVHCMDVYQPDPTYVKKAQRILGNIDVEWRRGTGCEHCMGRGFRGRIVLDELMTIPAGKREDLARLQDRNQRRRILSDLINHTLLTDGVLKAAAGLTTLEDVMAVVGDQAY